MKKGLLIVSAALAMFAMAACGNTDNATSTNAQGDKEVVYTGMLPAADVSGVRYVLHLKYDDDKNYTDGDYKMFETYVEADSTATGGYKDMKTVRSEGDFTVQTGIAANPQAKYLKLVPDMKDSDSTASSQPVYFEVTSDSTLLMLNSELQTPSMVSEYTLTANK